MLAVTVSPKFQIVIPLAMRERLHIEAGQKLQVLAKGTSLRLLAQHRRRAPCRSQPLRVLGLIEKIAHVCRYYLTRLGRNTIVPALAA